MIPNGKIKASEIVSNFFLNHFKLRKVRKLMIVLGNIEKVQLNTKFRESSANTKLGILALFI